MADIVRGQHTFAAGAIGLAAVGLVHGLAFASAVFFEPRSEAEAAYRRAAREYHATIGPLEPNAWGGTQILSASYSVLLVQVGVLNLFTMRAIIARGRLRLLTVLNLVFLALQLAVAVAYQFPPPIVLGGVVFVLFAASLWRQTSGPSA